MNELALQRLIRSIDALCESNDSAAKANKKMEEAVTSLASSVNDLAVIMESIEPEYHDDDPLITQDFFRKN